MQLKGEKGKFFFLSKHHTQKAYKQMGDKASCPSNLKTKWM
jgi:hypothetical protein